MSSENDEIILNVIQTDLLRELMKDKCVIYKYLNNAVAHAEFSAARYKEKECYEELLALRRARNIFKTYIEVSSHGPIDCT